jgi:hypothetical protein
MDVEEDLESELIPMNKEKLMPTYRSHYGEEIIWSELFKEDESNNPVN